MYLIEPSDRELIGFDPIDILYMRSQCPLITRACSPVGHNCDLSIPKRVTVKWDNGGRGWGKTADHYPGNRRRDSRKKKQQQKSGMYNKLGNRMITHFLNWVTTNLGDSSICPDGQCLSLRSSKLTDILVPASLLYSSQPRPAVANYSDIPLRSNKIIYMQLKLKTLSPIMTDLQIKVLWSD